ncbi:MAG: glycosyl hydrolase family 18 protein [Gammaproteobacteria bacterium]
MRRYFIFIILFLCLCSSEALATSKNNASLQVLLYTNHQLSGRGNQAEDLLARMRSHHQVLNIIAPQTYTVDQNGVVAGSIDERLLKFARAKNIKIMPLLINTAFSQKDAHEFLHDSDAQNRAIKVMLDLGKNNYFYGWQLDFEHIAISDRADYTKFIDKVGKELHQNNLRLSVAVLCPPVDIASSHYTGWLLKNWNGSFDYSAIANSSDFITLMSYDQHTRATPPGPVASIIWVEAIIKKMLHDVPANKIFLGVPVYSGYWFAGMRNGMAASTEKQLGYDALQDLLRDKNIVLHWDNADKISYVRFTEHGTYSYIFAEDKRSFAAKLRLAKKYHLRGIAIWRLGTEDPGMWSSLSKG